MSFIINKIRERITKQNKNAVVLICGGLGTGKSFSAIKIAKAINPNFDLDVHLVFRAKAFLDLINSGKLKRGDVVIWDEIGVEFGARAWQTLASRAISSLLQTFRHLNLCLIVTVPQERFVDVNLRRLCHYYFETKNIDFKKNICSLKPLEIEVNPRMDKPYYKYLRTREGSRIVKITELEVSLLDQKTIQHYEKIKKKFTKDLNIRLGKIVAKAEKKTQPKHIITDDEAIRIIKKKIKGRITIPKIRSIVPVGLHRASILREKYLSKNSHT